MTALCLLAVSVLFQPPVGAAPQAPDPKQPAAWLIPGNGFEPVATPSIGWGETSYLRWKRRCGRRAR